MASVLPAQGDNTLTYTGTTGSARYTFNADGTATVVADELKVSYQLGGGVDLAIEVALNGTGTADYSVAEGDMLSTTNVNVDDLVMALTIGGLPAGDSTTLGDIVPFFGEGGGSTPFTCSSTTLTYIPAAEGAQAVVFTRVGF